VWEISLWAFLLSEDMDSIMIVPTLAFLYDFAVILFDDIMTCSLQPNIDRVDFVPQDGDEVE
jgi:hypothetical protein